MPSIAVVSDTDCNLPAELTSGLSVHPGAGLVGVVFTVGE